jgi:hypothetical protein
MSVENIQVGVTTEGFQTIAAMIANGTVFTIGYFRITNLGDSVFYDSKKVYDAVDPDAYHLPYSATDFEADHGVNAIDLSSFGIGDSDGFIPINSVELADSMTVEMNCYIPPTTGTSFTCNEIMVYTGSGTLVDPYKSFIWAIFPAVTKIDKYGLNLRVLCQL